MPRRHAHVIDRALKQLADPALVDSRAGRRLEKLLVTARKSGDLPVEDLRRAAVDLVDEVDVSKYFAKDSDEAENSGLAIIFLLILLALLAALVDEDSDVAALIEELIQSLLDSLKGS